jgi:8-oxo-dGTP pyrophosphatase MutT (NUDIX family)
MPKPIIVESHSYRGTEYNVEFYSIRGEIPNLPWSGVSIIGNYKGKVPIVTYPFEKEWEYPLAIPGGHVEKNESVDAAIKREMLEETNMIVTNWEPIGYEKVTLDKNNFIYELKVYAKLTKKGNFINDPGGHVNGYILMDIKHINEATKRGKRGDWIINEVKNEYKSNASKITKNTDQASITLNTKSKSNRQNIMIKWFDLMGKPLPDKEWRQVHIVANFNGKVVFVHFNEHNMTHLPGGHLERGEDIETAMRREFMEETGGIILEWEPIGYQVRTDSKGNMDNQLRVYAKVSGIKKSNVDYDGATTTIKLVNINTMLKTWGWENHIGERILKLVKNKFTNNNT